MKVLSLNNRAARTTCEALEPRRMLAAADPGTGLLATYYPTMAFSGKPVARVDKKVYFDTASLPATIAPTTYSVRWTGKIKPSYSETYTFSTHADDGVRLWVNHHLIIDDWNVHAAETRSAIIKLKASRKVDIQLEYFNRTGEAVAQLWWESPSQIKSVVPTSRLYPEQQDLADRMNHAFAFAQSQIALTLADTGNNPDVYVINTKPDGTWETTTGEAWTSGFLGAQLWQLYQRNGRKALRLNATAWTRSLADQSNIGEDAGFRIGLPYLSMYALSNDASDRAVLLAAADAKMTQFNATVGMFSSPGGTSVEGNPSADFAVLLDHAMDMPLLYWAANETADASYAQRANAHLLKLAQHYVRADGSTAQWGYFVRTTGAFAGHAKKQGYSADSAWSRGQAWAMHAYAAAYDASRNASLLEIARKAADYWLANVPADGVSYWDFVGPNIPDTYRDSSAAAIAASALVQLSRIDPDEARRAKYLAGAQTILHSLCSPAYLAEGTASHGTLLHGAAFVPRKNPIADASLIYGDYYFLEAMNRYIAAL